MNIEILKDQVEKLNKSDFLRLYLIVTNKFAIMRKDDSSKVSKLLYNIKNPEKVKACMNHYRKKE
jgi:hypothetical protein